LTEFLTAILAFPTVVFTILLGVVVVYWLFVLLGALDIDLLGDADLDGGHDLHLDGHGHFDGHGHADAHFDAHGHADHGHGAHYAHDAHGGHEAGGLAGLIQALGLGGVPVTVMLSILILAAWSFCLGAMQLLGGSPGWLLFAAALLSLTIAVPLTSLLVRPLRRFFVTLPATRHRDLLGKVCTITTLRVDERYGQAEIEDGGAGLIVQVRANGPSPLARGDRALIFDYKDEVFHVAPVDEALRQGLDNLA
jgi:hypothetical protein